MRIKGVKKSYKAGDKSVVALDDINFELPQRGMVFILGKSGSGKSTLLNVMSGLDKADEGSIEVGGKDITKCSESELCKFRNSYCGFIFQEYNLISELNVGENIKLSLQLQGEKNVEERVREVLKRVGLEGYESRKATELSGGEKQRIAIARAIIKDPKIIFADEPTGALDEKTGQVILELLKGISADRLVMVVTHDREFAERYGDRIIELADGKIVRDSNSQEQGDEKESEWKKPKLPIKAALKIGCSNFKYHPIRLVVTVLLSVIAFTFLGVSLNISMNDDVKVYLNAFYDSGLEYTKLYKEVRYPNPFVSTGFFSDEFFGENKLMSEPIRITLADMDMFANVNNGAWAMAFVSSKERLRDIAITFPGDDEECVRKINSEIKKTGKHFSPIADGYIYVRPENLDDFGLSIIVGELPKNKNEVAINDCILRTCMLCGIVDEDGKTYTIKEAKDIIGHRIPIDHSNVMDSLTKEDYRTICGVVNTGCDRECAIKHFGDNENPANEKGLHDKIFVCEKYFSGYFSGYTCAICKIGSNYDAFAKMVMNYENKSDSTGFYFANSVASKMAYVPDMATRYKVKSLYLSIIFLVFAIIFLMNFITVSIRSQLKQTGILSAVGVDFGQMTKIYLGSALIVGGIICLLLIPISSVLVVALKNSIIAKYSFDYLMFNAAFIPVLIGCVFATVILGCIIPLLRFRKISPIEKINRGAIK